MPDSKDERPWQFRLVWIFVAMFVVGFGCVLWNANPPGWAVLFMMFASYLLPAMTVSAVIHFHGYVRSFFVGVTVVLAFWAIEATEMFTYFPIDPDSFVRVLSTSRTADDVFSIYSRDIGSTGFHRTTLVVFLVSIVAGIGSTLVHRCVGKLSRSTN